MTQAYFLIPGLILPDSAKNELDASTLAVADALSSNLADEPIGQNFSRNVFARAVHLQWAWSVITRRKTLPHVTAFSWLMDQGPMLATEIWQLHLANRDASGVMTGIKIADETLIEAVSMQLTRPLLKHGFVLQRWDTTLYLTRKSDWGVAAAPWCTIRNTATPADMALQGLAQDEKEAQSALAAALAALQDLTTELAAATLSDAHGVAVNALWISGGGHQQLFFPPTLLRSVLADDPAIIGWAQNAGILNHRTGRLTGANAWPDDAPNGECLAVIDALYEPWLAGDWKAWSQALPGVISQINTLSQAALHKKGCDAVLVVGCGEAKTVSLPLKLVNPKSLIARFSRKKAKPADPWIFGVDPQAAA